MEKEFIDLCANWITGKEQNKNLFKKYENFLKSNSIKTTGFRIWTFEGSELKNVIFNEGNLDIEENVIESCFQIENELVNPFSGKIQHIEGSLIESVQKWITPYVDNFRIITRYANDYFFNPYKALEFGINEFKNGNKEYLKEDYDFYNKTLKFYKHQNEILFLGQLDTISSDEIIYIMVSKKLLDSYLDIDDLNDIIYHELEDYYTIYNNEHNRDVLLDSNFKLEFESFNFLFKFH